MLLFTYRFVRILRLENTPSGRNVRALEDKSLQKGKTKYENIKYHHIIIKFIYWIRSQAINETIVTKQTNVRNSINSIVLFFYVLENPLIVDLRVQFSLWFKTKRPPNTKKIISVVSLRSFLSIWIPKDVPYSRRVILDAHS